MPPFRCFEVTRFKQFDNLSAKKRNMLPRIKHMKYFKTMALMLYVLALVPLFIQMLLNAREEKMLKSDLREKALYCQKQHKTI